MKGTELATIETTMKALTFTSDEIQFIKEKYAPKATELEFKEFIALCQIHNASPLKKELYFIKYGDGENAKANIVFSYHWLISKAMATGLYKGLTDAEYADDSGNWTTLWLDKEKMPVACKVGVFTKGFERPTYATVYWKERAKNQAEWKNQPLHMLMKCAVVAAIKLAIPDLSGIYIREEMMDDMPYGEWMPDPEKSLAENAIEAGRQAAGNNAEKQLFKNGEISGKPTQEQLDEYNALRMNIEPEDLKKLMVSLGYRSIKTISSADCETLLIQMRGMLN